MLPRTTTKVNCENKQKFDNRVVESAQVPQSPVGMSAVIQNLRDCGRGRDMVSAEILEGTNEKAADILRSCNCYALIPGTMFAPLDKFAEFYGVTEQYIKSVLRRRGIIQRNTPGDVIRMSGSAFLAENGLADKFCNHYSGVYQYRNDNHTRAYSFSCVKSGNFYSARVVLAFATLMFQARNINGDRVGKSVYKILMNSSYADAARFKKAEIRERENLEMEANMAVNNQNENNAILNQEGNLVLTPEFFAALIKTAVREAVSECMKEFVPKSQCIMTEVSEPSEDKKPPVQHIRHRSGWPKKLVKPKNWEQIVSDQKAGRITRAAAAKMSNMSVTSYDNYSKGVKQF